jgi:hypothetical protein
MRFLAGKLVVTVLLGGAVATSLALPFVFDSTQRPLAGPLSALGTTEPQRVLAPPSIFQSGPRLKPRLAAAALPQAPLLVVAPGSHGARAAFA